MLAKEYLIDEENFGDLQLYEPEIPLWYDKVSPEQAAEIISTEFEKLSYASMLDTLYGFREPAPLLLAGKTIFLPVTEIPIQNCQLVLLDFESHPSDFDDMKPGIMLRLPKQSSITEIISTYGEMGWDGHSHAETKQQRRGEVEDARMVIPRETRYLQQPDGTNYPDGMLQLYRAKLRESIKSEIREKKPNVITMHNNLYFDHPDHIAVGESVLRALRELSTEEGYKPPAVYASDPEFGYSSAGKWAYDLLRTMRPGFRREQFVSTEPPKLTRPDFIVDVSPFRVERLTALYQHTTQIMEPGKEYALRIPALARVRGEQVGVKWGEALFQVKIPGVTATENRLAAYLPMGSMYQRKRV